MMIRLWRFRTMTTRYPEAIKMSMKQENARYEINHRLHLRTYSMLYTIQM